MDNLRDKNYQFAARCSAPISSKRSWAILAEDAGFSDAGEDHQFRHFRFARRRVGDGQGISWPAPCTTTVARRDKSFVAQFCGNLSETLLESELFGHKRGAFTGAISDKKGLLEVANGGTFFLDEVADMPISIQSKLLRVLQDGEFRRVGDTETRKVDVRIISATNKSLAREVERGTFREDLFYRLNVITIRMPALRDRVGDVPLLVQHFLNKHVVKSGERLKKVTPEAMKILDGYHWPGNVRELENAIERAMVLAERSRHFSE